MTDWLKELDRLELAGDKSSPKVGHSTHYYILLWEHARELIDAAKENIDLRWQTKNWERKEIDRAGCCIANEEENDDLKALLRRVRDSSKICPLKCTGICEIVEALNG